MCVPMVAGVSVIRNEGQGRWEREGRVPKFEELWRRGGTREAEELALPITIAAGPDGRIAIPDFQLAEVIVVEGDGTWRGPITRGGSGPGEVRHAVAAAWRDDGGLVVFDILGSKLVFLDSEGSPLAQDLALDPAFAGPTVARGELDGIALQPTGAPILSTRFPRARESGMISDERQGVVLRLDAGSGRVDTLAAPVFLVVAGERYGEAAVPGWPRPVADAGGPFAAVAATDGSYRILIIDENGAPLRQICRAADGLPVADRELGSPDTEEPMRALSAALRSAPAPAIPASVGRLIVTRAGGLWVQRERPSLFGSGLESIQGVAGATYDVFDEDGEFLGSVNAPAGAMIQDVAGERVWAFATGEFAETWVVAYALRLEAS